MSESQSTRSKSPANDRTSRFWFVMSVCLSLGMGVWLCYRPFASESPGGNAKSAKRVRELLVFSDDFAIRGGSLEEVRVAANEADRQLLEELAKRNEPKKSDSAGSGTNFTRWRQRYERARMQIQSLGEIEEESLEMGFKKDRLKALADRPPAF